MLNTIGIVSMKGVDGGEMFSIPYLKNYIDILETAILFLIAWLFYRIVMKKLSELSMTNISINWKIFTVPPAIFLVAYGVVSLFIAFDPDFSEDLNCLLVYTFTTVIIFIFIWAFHVIIKNLSVTGEIKTLSVEVMEALAHTIDAKDEYTRGHSVRVAKYSRMLAEKMGLPAEQCENVYYMGLLHDIGKIGVPNEIINSPTKLTDEEYDVIKTHPGIGFDILAEMKSHPELSTGARWHHERFDGGGYPDRKTNEEIPLEARIIAVADSYDAMTSNRSYRKYMPQEKVRSEIEKNVGKQFDPEVAETMLGIIDGDVDYVLHE
ncbi:MAG: HD-GYP domain-containing protein [Lachnospiraceae bacterium]|nr:HD-GYP domain-containing protein [Lachnospiraceae bacterium]